MAPLSLGAIGAILSKKNIISNPIFQKKYIEILILLLMLIIISFDYRYILIVCGILNLYLVLKAYHFGFKVDCLDKILLNSKLIFIGRISYGIYLYHNLIGYYFTNSIFDPIWKNIPFDQIGMISKIQYHSWVIKFPLYSFVSIVFAYISFKYIESPILKFKNRFA
jgi:peptidoglycan/LPS O-acetylase OafA/YrhL